MFNINNINKLTNQNNQINYTVENNSLAISDCNNKKINATNSASSHGIRKRLSTKYAIRSAALKHTSFIIRSKASFESLSI